MQAGSCSASQMQFKHSTTTHKHTHLISCWVKNLGREYMKMKKYLPVSADSKEKLLRV
jgi:hypothetical protein